MRELEPLHTIVFGRRPAVEIRQVFEDDDFAASDPTGELRAQDEKRRQRYARKA